MGNRGPVGIAVGYTASTGGRRHVDDTDPIGRPAPPGQAVAGFVAAPIAKAYSYCERWIGMPREMTGAASVFFFGLGALVFAFLSRQRLHYAGGALALILLGIAIPLCTCSRY
jgi:hypothetical protein